VHDREHPAHRQAAAGTKIAETSKGAPLAGRAPTGVVDSDDAVFVSLAHEDAVAKISADGSKLLAQTDLSPFSGRAFSGPSKGRPLRGVMPSGLALRGGRIYVAESGIDAVGVLDAASMQVIEHIPWAGIPPRLRFSPDGQTLYVVNTKGKGAGPNGGKQHDPNAPTMLDRWNGQPERDSA
jgi:YVTN family beta-propeller protein